MPIWVVIEDRIVSTLNNLPPSKQMSLGTIKCLGSLTEQKYLLARTFLRPPKMVWYPAAFKLRKPCCQRRHGDPGQSARV